MKIALFEVSGVEHKMFTDFFVGMDVSIFEEKLDLESSSKAKEADIVSIFINSEVRREVLDNLPNLKFIATRSTGFDHIDLASAKEKGILVSNVPAYGSHTVAEFTFALLLALSRKIYPAYNNLREGTDFHIADLGGFDLKGKTLGVIGTGKIGKNVIRIAKGFEMNVLAYDLYPDIAFAQEMNFEYQSLAETISHSDVLTLHTLYNKESYHLINKENISLMKKGVYLINTARGELVDTSALIWGLKEGIIAGAALDVLEGERELKEEIKILASPGKADKVKDYRTLLEGHVLIDMPNVIVTPHIAFFSKEAEQEIIKITVENIKNFEEGKPINLVK